MTRILKFYIIIFLISLKTALGAIDSHPRVLITQNDVDRIAATIQNTPAAQQDFDNFITHTSSINTPILYKTDLVTLHRLLNKIMKNSFLYMMGTRHPFLQSHAGYAAAPEEYMQNILNDLLILTHPDTINKIQKMGALQGPGYAVKSLAIAYDWGYDYFKTNTIVRIVDLERALRQWADWYTAPNRYYGSVFENHAPWGAKSLAYIAASLGDNNLFYGTETKIQASMLPENEAESVGAEVHISAKGFFDQILDAVNFVASPRGGWYESMSYFLSKEMPELLEYAEVVCTFHDDEAYTNSVYSSPLFKNAGLFLYHMTTPDGMLHKFADTGAQTALPSGLYQPGGNTYGDINNVGVGYLGGYFLRRLYSRLKNGGFTDHAQFVKFYADEFCFDFKGPIPNDENNINVLYSLLWRDYSDSVQITTQHIEENPLFSNSIYFDNTGILISKTRGENERSDTIVRFDALPYFFGNHQHFAAGNFTMFKGANLAIDGGRYVSPQTKAARNYAEHIYRQSISHNVVLIGEELIGQKSFQKQSNRAPFTMQQLHPFQEYSTGPQNISIFRSEEHGDNWECPWNITGMTLNLTSLYDHADVSHYSRTLVHLSDSNPENSPSDFILTFDNIELDTPNSVYWQMHFRDNGKNQFLGDSIYVIARDEKINTKLVKADFYSHYMGQLFVKSLSPNLEPSIHDFTFPDSICQNCWNGRIWEESTDILRFRSAPKKQHDIFMALAPARIDTVSTKTISDFSQPIKEINADTPFFKSIKIRQKKNSTALYFNMAKLNKTRQNHYSLHFENPEQGWMIFYGINPGEWEIRIEDKNGDILQTRNGMTQANYPRKDWGVLCVPIDKKNEGYTNIMVSLTQF